jgi:hypothetical protein
VGTKDTPFQKTAEFEAPSSPFAGSTTSAPVAHHFSSITAMPQYKAKSVEELRHEDCGANDPTPAANNQDANNNAALPAAAAGSGAAWASATNKQGADPAAPPAAAADSAAAGAIAAGFNAAAGDSEAPQQPQVGPNAAAPVAVECTTQTEGVDDQLLRRSYSV